MIIERALCPILVHREDELTLLEDALLGSARGAGQVVVLAGDAGMGKTRLATETVERAHKIGAAVMWGGCSEADLALPYLPFLEGIGNWLASADVPAIKSALGAATDDLAQLFPQLGASGSSSQSLDPAQAKLRLYEGILSLLRLAAGSRGALVIVEDLHWADPSSRELLDYLTRRIRSTRIMVLATYRLDEMHRKHPLVPIVQGWRRSRLAEIIELKPLPAEGVEEMVRAIFEEHDVSSEFRDFLYERTEGNPFVLEEMLKAAIDRGDIYRAGNKWERKAVSDLTIPRSVADSILARLERFDEEHAEVLRAGAVLGPAFRYETVIALTKLPESTVQAALQEGVLQQLIVAEAGGHKYRFRHALTREAIYEDLIVPRRQELHLSAAGSLQNDPFAAPVDVAFHLLAAGRNEDAVPFCIKAADDALTRSAFREGAELLERTLPYMGDAVARGRMLGRIGNAYAAGGDTSSSRANLERAIEILEGNDLRRDAATLRLTLGRVYWVLHRPDVAASHYEAARDALERDDPSGDLAVAYVRLAGLAYFDFRFEESAELATKAIAIAEAANDDYARIWAYNFLGAAIFDMGREAEGFEWMHRSIDESIERGFDEVASNGIHNTAITLMSVGRLEEARTLLPRLEQAPRYALNAYSRTFLPGNISLIAAQIRDAERTLSETKKLADENDWPTWQIWAQEYLGLTIALAGRFDEAFEMLPSYENETERQEIIHRLTAWLLASMTAGQMDQALRHARVALANKDRAWVTPLLIGGPVEVFVRHGLLDEAREHLDACSLDPSRGNYPSVMWARGMLLTATGSHEEAIDLLRDAARRLRDSGNHLIEQRVRMSLAVALSRMGRRKEARSELLDVATHAYESGAFGVEKETRTLAARLGIDIGEERPLPQVQAGAALRDASERLVTVMFADVRGYTAMTRRHAPAEMIDRMSSFYRWARREIERETGMVDSYAGDAVMASFNTSTASLDHAIHAITAGIALQDKAALLDLPVGIGIAVGPAVVGRLTGGTNVDVIGESTNLAARLQSQATAGEIVLSEDAYRRVRTFIEQSDFIATERMLTLKGYDEPVRAYVVARS